MAAVEARAAGPRDPAPRRGDPPAAAADPPAAEDPLAPRAGICVGDYAVHLEDIRAELEGDENEDIQDLKELDLTTRAARTLWLEKALGLPYRRFRSTKWPLFAQIGGLLGRRRVGVKRMGRRPNIGVIIHVRGRPLAVRNSLKATKILIKPGDEIETIAWVIKCLKDDYQGSGHSEPSGASASDDHEAEAEDEEMGDIEAEPEDLVPRFRDQALKDIRADPRVHSAWWCASRNSLVATTKSSGGLEKCSVIVQSLERLRKSRSSETILEHAFAKAISALLEKLGRE